MVVVLAADGDGDGCHGHGRRRSVIGDRYYLSVLDDDERRPLHYYHHLSAAYLCSSVSRVTMVFPATGDKNQVTRGRSGVPLSVSVDTLRSLILILWS